MKAIPTRRSLRTATLDAAKTAVGATAGAAMGLVLLFGIALGMFSDRPVSGRPGDQSPTTRR